MAAGADPSLFDRRNSADPSGFDHAIPTIPETIKAPAEC